MQVVDVVAVEDRVVVTTTADYRVVAGVTLDDVRRTVTSELVRAGATDYVFNSRAEGDTEVVITLEQI